MFNRFFYRKTKPPTESMTGPGGRSKMQDQTQPSTTPQEVSSIRSLEKLNIARKKFERYSAELKALAPEEPHDLLYTQMDDLCWAVEKLNEGLRKYARRDISSIDLHIAAPNAIHDGLEKLLRVLNALKQAQVTKKRLPELYSSIITDAQEVVHNFPKDLAKKCDIDLPNV